MKKIAGITLFCCGFFITHAQNEILKGTIGTLPVIMELFTYEDTVASVTYFYENRRKNIELNGKVHKDGSITVVCYNNYDERFNSKSEKLELKKVKDRYTGKWISTKKTLPVNLTLFSIEGIKHPFAQQPDIQKLKKESPLDYVRTAGLQFIKDSTIRKNGFFLDWYHEKYSHIPLFRLRKETMTSSIKKVNQQLEEIQIGQSNAFLTCTSSKGDTEYGQTINSIYLNNDLLSINMSTSYYCGGAHPDFASTGFNFDLNTGALLNLDDVLWFGKTKIPKEDTDGWYNYRDSVFAPKVVALLKQLYPKEMKKPANEAEYCDYSEPKIWNFPNWHFTPKGLYMGGYFARVARACDQPEWSIIPYKIVRKYLNPSIKIKLPE